MQGGSWSGSASLRHQSQQLPYASVSPEKRMAHTSISRGRLHLVSSTQLLGSLAIASLTPLSSKSPPESCSNPG